MKSTLRISLKAGEKIFINGAVLRVDRKVALEFLNDVTFLLENHVLQPEDTTTPLRQLYFICQMMLINPEGKEQSMTLFRKSIMMLLTCFRNEEILAELKRTAEGDDEAAAIGGQRRQQQPLPERDADRAVRAMDGVERLALRQRLVEAVDGEAGDLRPHARNAQAQPRGAGIADDLASEMDPAIVAVGGGLEDHQILTEGRQELRGEGLMGD